jgi:hypothetical protein
MMIVEKKVVPYDTGKVKIGLLYTPPRDYVMSADADRLQDALLNPQVNPSWLEKLLAVGRGS